MEKEKIIIDCDPGSDDALAIILALYSGKLDLKAVCSVTGNGALDTTTKPTHLYDIEKTEADKKAVVIITLLGVLGIAGRVALWLI